MKSSNKAVKPVSPDFPIVELLPNQNLKLEAVAVLGTGKEHAKWQAANASYKYFPEFRIKDTKADIKKCIKKCPMGLVSVGGKKLVIKDPALCDLCESCVKGCDAVELVPNPEKIIFRVETVSGLSPEYIIAESSKILQNKAEDFKKQLKSVVTV